MKSFKLLGAIALNSLLAIQFANAGAPDWTLTGQEEGITVYKREVPGSPLMAFRGEGIVNASVERVAAVIFDTRRAPEWVVDLKESKLVKWVSKNEFIEYDHIKTPPIIMKDRDFVSQVSLKIDPKTKEMTFHYKSVSDPAVPESSKLIRGDLMNTTFILRPIEGNTKTHIIGEIHCDPRGDVPHWLVNWFQKGWPTDTLKNLRVQVAKTDIVIDDAITQLFAAK